MALLTKPDDVAVVGVATPMASAAVLLARELLHPDMCVIMAATVDPAVHDMAMPMLRPETLHDLGVGTLSQSDILDQIQRGRITVQFVSPAQVDRLGQLNTSRVVAADGTTVVLPGGLATGDIAVLVGRLIAYRASHTRRFLPRDVSFISGAGHDRAQPKWRQSRGLPGRGVVSVVTDKAVLSWPDATDRVDLLSIQPGVSIDEVTNGCGFDVYVPEPVNESPPPPLAALELLRTVIDPVGIIRLEVKDTRAAALAELEAKR